MSSTDPCDTDISSNDFADQQTTGVDPSDAEWTAAPEMMEELDMEPRPLPIRPLPPWRPISRKVSGRYRGTYCGWQLDLRVDVDGHARERPMRRVSGDFYRVSGRTIYYHGSFIVHKPTITSTRTTVTVEGTIDRTYYTGYPKIRVTIPKTTLFEKAAPATVQWFSLANRRGATYICPWVSFCFRAVRYEQDYETGVTPFTSYHTGSLPSGGFNRTLSVVKAYREAGIDFQVTTAANPIAPAGAGANLKWSNSELHNAMLTHFSLWRDIPQWAVWLFAANEHEYGTGLYGIMFDQQGKQRQGCAVFHKGIGGSTATQLRLQLYTYVHELGHCFNLLHSWQKSYATPPAPNRPSSLSWMNYPWYYPGGANAYWSNFAFQFDNLEVIHLRHAYRNNIIMGGNDFLKGSALTTIQDSEAFADPITDHSGLDLRIESPSSHLYGEPVVVDLRLQSTATTSQLVHTHLHPNRGSVQIGIRKPSGQIRVYQPLIEECWGAATARLDPDTPSQYESAYIGYGKDGFYFDEVGTYHLRAVYHALDGSLVPSNILPIRIQSPVTRIEDDVGSLFIGEEQGTLLALLGSDSAFLQRGNIALDQVLTKHEKHKLAVYAHLVKGINASRDFKQITPDRQITVRLHDAQAAITQITSVIEATEAKEGVDNITLNMAMRSMARIQRLADDPSSAQDTMDRMIGFFEKQKLRPHVLQTIQAQADQTMQAAL